MKVKLALIFKDSLAKPSLNLMAQIIILNTVKDAKKLAADFMRGDAENWCAISKKFYSNFMTKTAFFDNPLADDIFAYVIYIDSKIIQADFVETAEAMDFIEKYLPEIARIKIS